MDAYWKRFKSNYSESEHNMMSIVYLACAWISLHLSRRAEGLMKIALLVNALAIDLCALTHSVAVLTHE